MYAGGASIIVITVLVLGFLNSDTPSQVRDMRFDDQQISDLSDMQWRIEDHYRINKNLPATVAELYVGISVPVAPEGRETYSYSIIDEDTYELCASFMYESANGRIGERAVIFDESIAKNPYNNWDHGTGRTCFERTVIDYTKEIDS